MRTEDDTQGARWTTQKRCTVLHALATDRCLSMLHVAAPGGCGRIFFYVVAFICYRLPSCVVVAAFVLHARVLSLLPLFCKLTRSEHLQVDTSLHRM
jgi:hypothetical protein